MNNDDDIINCKINKKIKSSRDLINRGEYKEAYLNDLDKMRIARKNKEKYSK